MLEEFRAAKQPEIEALRAQYERDGVPSVRPLSARPPSVRPGNGRPGFLDALRQRPFSVIAEYKRASPSSGDIETTLTPEAVGRAYTEAGAAAVSVLTETRFFKGERAHIECMAKATTLPILRKDFIFDEVQIRDTASLPASAILLIARLFDDPSHLARLCRISAEYGLDVVMEVFDEKDLAKARQTEARIIQVNHRDLQTMVIDSTISERLIAEKQAGEYWISASGIENAAQRRQMESLGFDAVLVGTALMRGGAPAAALTRLLA